MPFHKQPSHQSSDIDSLFEQVALCVAAPSHKAKKDVPWPRFFTFLENIGWAQLFAFDMNRFYDDTEFSLEIQFRQKLFHLDNFDDDTVFDASVSATIGMYFEYPLIGIGVRHQADGVPIFDEDHPIRSRADVRLMRPHDFAGGGEMPKLLRRYEEVLKIARGRFEVQFPIWTRGPLDMAIALRGYEQFVDDTIERPQFVHDLLDYLTDERIRWWEAYFKRFPKAERTSGIADDWINIPFISPAMFEDFVLPRYYRLREFHGHIVWVHSCGNKAPVQKRLLELGIDSHEVNPWTDLDATLANIPADGWLCISILNADVLLATPEKRESDLRRYADKCAGRKFQVVGSAIQKMHADIAHDIEQTRLWVAIARRVLGREQR